MILQDDQTQNSQPELLKQVKSRSSQRSFSPYQADILEINKGGKFWAGVAVCEYSQRHQMIIICPATGAVQFYDANTLMPHKSREVLEIKETLTHISFWPETDDYLMGCIGGIIYCYNASTQVLRKLHNGINQTVFSIAFINSQYYAFSLFGSEQIHIGNFQKQEEFVRRNSRYSDPICFQNLAERKALVSGLFNGLVVIYRTDKLPTKLPIFCSIKPYQTERGPTVKIESARFFKSEFIITFGSEGRIRVWNLTRRRMRLIRMVKIEQPIRSGIYLEDYKMLVITCPGCVKFISLMTGKLESTVELGMRAEKVFLMKDKNTIGVIDSQRDQIKMVKLC